MGECINIYQNRINAYLQELDNVQINDPLCVLEWFYKVIDANIMFETNEVSSYVYNKLKSSGYRETIDAVDEAKTYYTLMKGNLIDDISLSRNIISLILSKLKESKSLDLALISFVVVFNEKYNKESILKFMMEKLHKNIGNRVVFYIINNNEFELKTGELEEVDDYHTVTIDHIIYPFNGDNIGIVKIASQNGNVLYNNSEVKKVTNLNDDITIPKVKEYFSEDNYGQDELKVI